MSIWFFIWFVLSAILLFFSGWTFYILHMQKAGWRGFSKKHNLRCRLNKDLSSVEVSGMLDGYSVSLFTSEHIVPEQRGAQKLSAIEIEMHSAMPISGAVGSGNMVNITQTLDFKSEIVPSHDEWSKEYIVRTNEPEGMEAYLTAERLSVLTSLMKFRGASVILIFKKEAMILRIDSHDPLETLNKVESLVQRMIEAAVSLELKDGESKMLTVKKEAAERMVSVKEGDDEDTGLSLEDEEESEEEQAEEG